MHLNTEIRNHGRPDLVMIHGLTRRWQTYTPLLPSLESRYSLTLLDLPGHGESEPNPAGYLVKDYCKAVIEWVDQTQLESFHLYGHSLGAMVAMTVAAERPQRVRSVILEDPPFHTMGNRIQQTVWLSHFSQVHRLRNEPAFFNAIRSRQVALLANVELFDPVSDSTIRLGNLRDASSLRFMAACMLKMRSEVIEPVVQGRWLDGWDWENIARQIEQPTCILCADEKAGGMLTRRDYDHLCSLLHDPVPVFFANSAHNLHWQKPIELLNSVHTFLDA